jgi:hypothetical protein
LVVTLVGTWPQFVVVVVVVVVAAAGGGGGIGPGRWFGGSQMMIFTLFDHTAPSQGKSA